MHLQLFPNLFLKLKKLITLKVFMNQAFFVKYLLFFQVNVLNHIILWLRYYQSTSWQELQRVDRLAIFSDFEMQSRRISTGPAQLRNLLPCRDDLTFLNQ